MSSTKVQENISNSFNANKYSKQGVLSNSKIINSKNIPFGRSFGVGELPLGRFPKSYVLQLLFIEGFYEK